MDDVIDSSFQFLNICKDFRIKINMILSLMLIINNILTVLILTFNEIVCILLNSQWLKLIISIRCWLFIQVLCHRIFHIKILFQSSSFSILVECFVHVTCVLSDGLITVWLLDGFVGVLCSCGVCVWCELVVAIVRLDILSTWGESFQCCQESFWRFSVFQVYIFVFGWTLLKGVCNLLSLWTDVVRLMFLSFWTINSNTHCVWIYEISCILAELFTISFSNWWLLRSSDNLLGLGQRVGLWL